MENIKILEISRIDYPEFESRVEEEPLGFFLKIREDGLGIRVNIDNSGQNIEYRIQNYNDCEEFIYGYYGVLTRTDSNSKLNQLLHQNIRNVYLAIVDSKQITGENFQIIKNEIVGIQFQFDEGIFTFYNDGDEGKYTFDMPKCPIPFLFGGISWQEVSPSSP